jgi:hypothetical protein
MPAMPRTGGGFDASHNAQTAVDDTAHIVVTAEVTNQAADSWHLPGMLQAVRCNTDADAEQALADAGYRNEPVFEQLKDHPTELIVALGREGKQHGQFNQAKYPCTAAMAAKLRTDEGRDAYRRSKWIAEPPNGWVKSVLGFRQFSLRGLHRVNAEWKFVCMALNLRRMCALTAC